MIEKIALTVPGQEEGYEIVPVVGMQAGGINVVDNIVQWATTTLLIAASLLAIALIVYGGLKITSSGGDKAAIESGRKVIIFAIIGLIIIFSSFMIMGIIQSLFGVRLLGGVPFIR